MKVAIVEVIDVISVPVTSWSYGLREAQLGVDGSCRIQISAIFQSYIVRTQHYEQSSLVLFYCNSTKQHNAQDQLLNSSQYIAVKFAVLGMFDMFDN